MQRFGSGEGENLRSGRGTVQGPGSFRENGVNASFHRFVNFCRETATLG